MFVQNSYPCFVSFLFHQWLLSRRICKVHWWQGMFPKGKLGITHVHSCISFSKLSTQILSFNCYIPSLQVASLATEMPMRTSAKQQQKLNKSLLKDLLDFNFRGNLVLAHGQFNNSLNSELPTRSSQKQGPQFLNINSAKVIAGQVTINRQLL